MFNHNKNNYLISGGPDSSLGLVIRERERGREREKGGVREREEGWESVWFTAVYYLNIFGIVNTQIFKPEAKEHCLLLGKIESEWTSSSSSRRERKELHLLMCHLFVVLHDSQYSINGAEDDQDHDSLVAPHTLYSAAPWWGSHPAHTHTHTHSLDWSQTI